MRVIKINDKLRFDVEKIERVIDFVSINEEDSFVRICFDSGNTEELHNDDRVNFLAVYDRDIACTIDEINEAIAKHDEAKNELLGALESMKSEMRMRAMMRNSFGNLQ